MSILQSIVLRYRASGHVRFELPRFLLEASCGDRLVADLGRQRGVYRVCVYPRQGKISIRYFEELAGFREVAAAFAAAARVAADEAAASGSADEATSNLVPLSRSAESGWLGAVWQETRETLDASAIVLRNVFGPTNGGGRNSLASEFLTDLLVLYLIKTHWHLIIQHWLRSPWLFRYEWTASIYMIYLLVRSKRPKS